ncbi:MAG: EVE domain-containing protein [Gemmatimonadota bacterium]
MPANHWLVKSEPDTYSIADLKRDGSTAWEGVRNYQARNLLKEMKKGDPVLFYHSSTKPPGVAGIAEVKREAYPDRHAWTKGDDYFDPKSSPENPIWFMVDIGYVDTLARVVTLDEIRATSSLSAMVLVNRSRLSVQPVTRAEFNTIVRMGRTEA